MATNTYVALDKVTLSSAAATATFSSIPSTYTDLVIVVSGTTNAGGTQGCTLQFNGDTGANYHRVVLYGNGSSAASVRDSDASHIAIGLLDDTQGNSIFHIQNYANTTTYKTAMARGSSAASQVRAGVGLWENTAAITSITIGLQGNNIAAGTTFSLYGIRAEGVSPAVKATGGAIYSDADYFYHVFGASGTFTPLQSLSADVLVVAGGGGASGDDGGAGGAGGLCIQSGRSMSATGYSITIGAGGAGNGGQSIRGYNGSNSVLDTITAVGGGGGGYGNPAAGVLTGASGGSGGGGGYGNSAAGGSATQGNSGGATGYGYAGGSGYGSANYGTGGGGGAGGVGGNGSSTNGGNGGIGRTDSFINSIGAATGTGQLVSGNYYFAGGGGGSVTSSGTAGTGGYGGGSAGGKTTASADAMKNTGGGGGADSSNGGSGVVIVRYAKV